MKSSIFALSLLAGIALAAPAQHVERQHESLDPIQVTDTPLSVVTDGLDRNLENVGEALDLSDLTSNLADTLDGSNINILQKRNLLIDLGSADDVLTNKGLELIKTMTLSVLNEDNIYVGNLEIGEDGHLLFDGTMNAGDAEGLIHGPMIIGGQDGIFQGDLTLVGEAGIIQGDAGVGGKPVLRLGLGGDRGLIVGLGEIDLIGGSAANGGDGIVTTWDQNLEEYRSSTAAAATATATGAATTPASAEATPTGSCGLLGLGCVL